MSATSSIEWTDRTWNPVRGCSIVSPGCVNCYAMKQAHRFNFVRQLPEGGFKAGPYFELTKETKAGPQWTGQVRTVEDALLEPLSWRKPQRVFVNSMSDLFHEDVPDDFIANVFAVMALSPWHTYQVLTKRAERLPKLLSSYDFRDSVHVWITMMLEDEDRPRALRWDALERRRDDARATAPDVCQDEFWPLPNVWLGVSVEDQKHADLRIPQLLQTPAAVRFISAEPLLGPVNLNFLWSKQVGTKAIGQPCPPDFYSKLHWVIVGGESGPGARRCSAQWVRSVVRQCRAAHVPVFVKQMGANVIDRNDAGFDGCEPRAWPISIEERDAIEFDINGFREEYQGADCRIHLKDRKGSDPAEWPDDLRVRQFPEVRA